MRRFMTTVLASTLLTACGGGDAFSPESVSGNYALQSVNGNSVPFSEIVQDGGAFSIISGSVSLNENSTFLLAIIVGVGTTVTDTETDAGTFELVEPATVRFTSSGGDVFFGTLDGRRLTVLKDGDNFVFRKATNLANIPKTEVRNGVTRDSRASDSLARVAEHRLQLVCCGTLHGGKDVAVSVRS